MLSPTGANASSPVPTSSTPISARSGRRAPANDSATSAWKPRGCDGVLRAGEHGHDGAVDLHRRAAHAARVAEGDEHHRRVAMQARAEVLRLGDQRRAVVPGRDQARLQHVAVDLEDAAVARLDGDVSLDVERRRRRAQLEVAPLGDGLPVLALALGRFPRSRCSRARSPGRRASAPTPGWRRRCARPRAGGPRARRRCRSTVCRARLRAMTTPASAADLPRRGKRRIAMAVPF